MFFLIHSLFWFTLVSYGASFFLNLPYQYRISRLACLQFLAVVCLVSLVWLRPELALGRDYHSYLWLLADLDLNRAFFEAVVCCFGAIFMWSSYSVRRPRPVSRFEGSDDVPATAQARPVDEGRKARFSEVRFRDISVSYQWRLNGGGVIFAHEFVRVVGRKIGKADHVFEYCAGPGFIGFALLAEGLCNRLTLADVNPEAVAAIKETIRKNNLQDKVTVYQSDCLDSIPESEKWNLVVGNPPWYFYAPDSENIRVADPHGRVHEKFYRDVGRFLAPGGSILLFEGAEFTDVHCFKGMIEKGGLKVTESFRSVSSWEVFRGLKEYPGMNAAYAAFLRICLFLREAYFIRVEKAETNAGV